MEPKKDYMFYIYLYFALLIVLFTGCSTVNRVHYSRGVTAGYNLIDKAKTGDPYWSGITVGVVLRNNEERMKELELRIKELVDDARSNRGPLILIPVNYGDLMEDVTQ